MPRRSMVLRRLWSPPITRTNQSQITYSYNPATLVLASELVKYDLDPNGTHKFTRTSYAHEKNRDEMSKGGPF
jgi:hypothetical protein